MATRLILDRTASLILYHRSNKSTNTCDTYHMTLPRYPQITPTAVQTCDTNRNYHIIVWACVLAGGCRGGCRGGCLCHLTPGHFNKSMEADACDTYHMTLPRCPQTTAVQMCDTGRDRIISHHRMGLLMEYWLVVAGVAAFATCLAASLAWSGRAAGGLEEELAKLKIRLDALETPHRADSASDAPDDAKRPVGTPKPPRQIRYGNITGEVLKIVSDTPQTARQIQTKLGQSREHVARTVKKMSEDEYLIRTKDRPFVYSITPKGRRMLEADDASEG